MNWNLLRVPIFCLASFHALAGMAAEPYTAYLMAYFGPAEKLYYAWSRDAREWTALNGGKPVFAPGVGVRDPYLQRVNGTFHLVHTATRVSGTPGWDHPTIGHWESPDLVHWSGGMIDVVPPDRKRAWAPEFVYEEETGLFHLFWASLHDGHNTIHIVTTRDWSDITPDRARVFYDIGIHDIDLTIVKHDDVYYGFHKPGDVDDRMGNRLSTSRTLDPETNTFAEGKPGKVVFENQLKPTEGPEVIQLIGQRKWYIYGDPFTNPMQAWETSDFTTFETIDVKTVPGSKHCSMLPITETELHRLCTVYADPVTTLLPHAKVQAMEWRYTFERPAENWFETNYDDSIWLQGKSGFGTKETPNTIIGTVWDMKQIWLRRILTLDEIPEEALYLQLHHDEDTTVYINGVRAAKVSWFNTDSEWVPVEEAAIRTLQPGNNHIAVHCQQTTGGQYIDVGLIAVKEHRWSRRRAWQWFNSQPWPCGFNYVPSNAISYTEMWMPYCFDESLIDEELALAEEIGFHCLRVVLPFVVWEQDPKAFKRRLDTFLGICDRRGIKVMFALFDDCAFGSDPKLINPWYGKQPDVLEGWYANGWTPSPGHGMVRNPSTWPRLERYVQDVITTFKDDSRVWVWDLYNEPTNGGLGNLSLPLVEKVFRWARDVDPSQPLTIAQFNGDATLNNFLFGNSDVITFHDYGPAEGLARHIETLQEQGRPIINTEWLNRGRGSLVKTCLPVFRKARVGCMHWGLVNGKTQTDLNWGHRPGQLDPPVWQHDLYYPDHRPYDIDELDLFRKTIRECSNVVNGVPPDKANGRL